MKDQHPWDPNFFLRSPLFVPVSKDLAQLLGDGEDWPSLADYNEFLNLGSKTTYSAGHAPIHFVSQEKKTPLLFDQYEARIFLSGAVQTRLQHWHDFFQVLVWRSFPKTKVTLNAVHFRATLARHLSCKGNLHRCAIENALTQFDECGVIIASTDRDLLQLIREFEWKELFWNRRDQLAAKLHCIVFGHALYEKALNPYLGMTGHALLIHLPKQGYSKNMFSQIEYLDQCLPNYFNSDKFHERPQDFSPFPLLGMPHWDTRNQQAQYYDNQAYFRPSRLNPVTNLKRTIIQISETEEMTFA